MTRFRLLAATVALLVLTGAVALTVSLEDEGETELAVFQPQTTTTSEPNFAALVESGVSAALPEEELELTQEAMARSTSTTSTSTSTTLATTTTTVPSTTTTASRASSPGQTTPTTSPPTTAPPTTATGGFDSGAEGDFASRINSLRSSNGLSGLARDGGLDSYARSWAKKLAEAGGLSHSNFGSLMPPWSAVGENVGVGASVGSIFDALVASSGHRQNMLGEFTHMGVGAYRDSAGKLWTAHVFTR